MRCMRSKRTIADIEPENALNFSTCEPGTPQRRAFERALARLLNRRCGRALALALANTRTAARRLTVKETTRLLPGVAGV